VKSTATQRTATIKPRNSVETPLYLPQPTKREGRGGANCRSHTTSLMHTHQYIIIIIITIIIIIIIIIICNSVAYRSQYLQVKSSELLQSKLCKVNKQNCCSLGLSLACMFCFSSTDHSLREFPFILITIIIIYVYLYM